MYANGELASARLVRFGQRLAGPGGENASISPVKRFAALPSASS